MYSNRHLTISEPPLPIKRGFPIYVFGNTRPHQLCWGGQKMVIADAYLVPSLELILASAPLCNNSSAISLLLLLQASCRGVQPALSWAFTEALSTSIMYRAISCKHRATITTSKHKYLLNTRATTHSKLTSSSIVLPRYIVYHCQDSLDMIWHKPSLYRYFKQCAFA